MIMRNNTMLELAVAIVLFRSTIIQAECFRVINGKTICCTGYRWSYSINGCEECPLGFVGLNCEYPCAYPLYGRECQSLCDCIPAKCNISIGCINTTNQYHSGPVNKETQRLTTERKTFQTSPWLLQKPTTRIKGILKITMVSSTSNEIKLPTSSTNVSKRHECWNNSQILIIVIILSSVIIMFLVINSLICGKYIRIRKKFEDRKQETTSVHYDEIPSKVCTPTDSELGKCEEIKLVFVHKNRESVLQMKPVKRSNDTSFEEGSQSELRASHILEIVGQSNDPMDGMRSSPSNPTDTDGYMLPVQRSGDYEYTENTEDYLTVFR